MSIFSNSSEYSKASNAIFTLKVYFNRLNLSLLCFDIPYQKLIVCSSILYLYIPSSMSDLKGNLPTVFTSSDSTLIKGEDINM